MSKETIEQGIDRRSFLKAAAATAVAATAVGSGAAFLYENGQQNSLMVPPPAVPLTEPIQVAAAAGEDASELLRRLVAAQAENVRLQAQLSTTQQQLEVAQGSVRGENSAAAEAVQMQLDQANGQVNILSGQVAGLSGLVALYEQLEQVDLGAVVDNGLESVGTVLDNLLDQVPSVEEGLTAGRDAVGAFEAQLPMLDHGRRWLANYLDRISLLYEAVENALQDAVEVVGSFLQLLEKWFEDLLKWLPFGIGRKASQTMSALVDLVGETPAAISGLKTNLAQPLDIWLDNSDGEIPLQRQLIKPVREEALDRAAQAIGHVAEVDTTYREALVRPVQLAAEQKQGIRQLIADYRQQHQL